MLFLTISLYDTDTTQMKGSKHDTINVYKPSND